MAFYDLNKAARIQKVEEISGHLLSDLRSGGDRHFLMYFSDEDTYIRKSAYLVTGKLFFSDKAPEKVILSLLQDLLEHPEAKVRQTAINAAGEIGKKEFGVVQHIFDKGLFDPHHSPRNAVIGCIKKMGEVNPVPVLKWARRYLHHKDKEVRREICHGIELRGRKHPGDILPMLRELEHDPTARVRNTLVHVLGQIAYKEGCLEVVLKHLKSWKNKALVQEALEEIIDVHERYRDFAAHTQKEALSMVRKSFM
jgi:hypothetical protein